jgi:hypothetical protein
VWFAIADYFAVSDLSVFWDVCEFDKEACVSYRNILNALKKAPAFVAKTLFPKWLQMGVFNKGHVLYFVSCDGVNDCIGLVLLGPMVISQGDGHVGSFHAAKFVLGQVAGSTIL